MRESEFRLNENEIRAFEVAQTVYQANLEASQMWGSFYIPVSPHEKVIAMAGGAYRDLNFNDPMVHHYLAHELLAHIPMKEWKNHDFVNRFTEAEFRYSIKHTAERNDFILGKEEAFPQFAGIGVEILSGLSSFLRQLKVPVFAAKMYKLFDKDGFDYADIAAIESLRPGIFSRQDIRDEFLKGFSLEKNALQYMTAKMNEEQPKKNTPTEKAQDEKLKKFARAHKINIKTLNTTGQERLKKILEEMEDERNQRTFEENLYKSKKGFAEMGSLAQDFNQKDLIRISELGIKTLNLLDTVKDLQKTFPAIKSLTDPNGPLGKALSMMGSTQPYLAVAAAAVQLGMAFFAKPQEDPFRKHVMDYLKATLEYLQVVRQEMHQRFDRVEGMIDQLSEQLDAVIQALITIINANHELQLKGMVHLESILQKDVKPALMSIENLIVDMKLGEVDEVLLHIQAHTNKRIIKEDVKTKLDELNAYDRTLVNFLKGLLVNPSVNGASKVSAKEIPDPAYLFKALDDNRIPLGFLDRYARFYLNMEDNLQAVNADHYPLLNYWPHAMQGHLASQMYGSQHYGAKMFTQDNNELIDIALNTRKFIESLTEHAPDLFLEIFTQYTEAAASLRDVFVKNLKKIIENDNNFKFTFKEAINKGWIKMPALYNEGTMKKLLAVPAANKAEFPAVLFLAMKLGLVELELTPEFARTKAEAREGSVTGVPCVSPGKRMRAVSWRYLEASSKLEFSLVFTRSKAVLNNTIVMQSYLAHRGGSVETKRGSTTRDTVRNHRTTVNKENAWSNETAMENTQFTAFGVSQTLARDINNHILDHLSELLIDNIQNKVDMSEQLGNRLTKITNVFFADALDTMLLSPASYASHERMTRLCQAIAITYARALGFKPETQEIIKQALVSDMKRLLSEPGLFPKALKVTELVSTLTAADPSPISSNPILHQMDAAIYTLNNFKALSYLHEGYLKNLNQWNGDLAYYQQMDLNLSQMQELSLEGFRFFNKQTISELTQKLHAQRNKFQGSYNSLMDMHNQLQTYGFPVAKPRHIDEAFKISFTSELTPPRRGVSLQEPSKMSLFEIIEKSGNPYLDTKTFLEALKFDRAVAHTHTLDSSGKTPLHHAAILGDSELIEVLINFDAPIAKKDHSGYTAIDYLPKGAKESRTLLRTRQSLQALQKDLGYSINQAIALLRDALEYMNSIDECETPADIIDGDTGEGKSTFISYCAGTDYKEVTDSKLKTNIEPTNNIKEVAKRGKMKSETKLPNIIPLWGLHQIDMAGDHDTEGNLWNMIKDFLHAIVMQKQKVTRARTIVISDKSIFDDRMVLARERLSKIGQSIKKDPARLMKHFIFVISKPNRHERLNKLKGDPKAYEKLVFEQFMELRESIGYVPDTHPDQDLLRVLDHMTVDNIFLGDVTKPESRERMRAKLEKMTDTPSDDFILDDLTNQAEPFKKLMSMVIANLETTNKKIEESVKILGNHWQKELNIATYHLEDLGEFANDPSLQALRDHEKRLLIMHEDLMAISNLLTQELKPFEQVTGGLTGDSTSITEELSELMREIQQQKKLVTDLGDLSIKLGLNVSDDIRVMVEKARPEPTHTELRVDGEPRCYELETAQMYPCSLPQGNTHYSLPGSNQDNEPESWERRPGFADQINDFLTVFRYGTYYLGYLLPSNWPRKPNDQDRMILKSTMAQIRTYEQPTHHLINSALNDPNLFDDRITAIVNNSRNITEAISNILNENSVTDNQLAEIKTRLDNTQSMLVELTDLNKELNQLRGKVAPNERLLVGRDSVTNKLTVSRELIPEPVFYTAPFIDRPPMAVFAPIWGTAFNRSNIPQQINKTASSNHSLPARPFK